jgi:hypothetical protein
MLAGSTNTTTTIQSNGTTAITIDSSQNVGIGTATPSARLHVTSSNGQIIAQATAGNPSLLLRSATNNRDWEVFSGSGDGSCGIYDGTAAATRFNIDTSGRVTMPFQPGFFIYGYTPSSVGANYFKATSPNTQWSVGSGLNLTGGPSGSTRYTAPVSGYYQFQWSLMGDASAGSRLIAFVDKNGSIVVESNSYSSQYNCANVVFVIYMAASDYLDFRASGPYYSVSNNAHYMSIRLLG